jgi:hypothetical protein
MAFKSPFTFPAGDIQRAALEVGCVASRQNLRRESRFDLLPQKASYIVNLLLSIYDPPAFKV